MVQRRLAQICAWQDLSKHLGTRVPPRMSEVGQRRSFDKISVRSALPSKTDLTADILDRRFRANLGHSHLCSDTRAAWRAAEFVRESQVSRLRTYCPSSDSRDSDRLFVGFTIVCPSSVLNEVRKERSQFMKRGNIHHQRNVTLDRLLADFEFDVQKQDEGLFSMGGLKHAPAVTADKDRQRHPQGEL